MSTSEVVPEDPGADYGVVSRPVNWLEVYECAAAEGMSPEIETAEQDNNLNLDTNPNGIVPASSNFTDSFLANGNHFKTAEYDIRIYERPESNQDELFDRSDREDVQAREALVKLYMPLARGLAHRFTNKRSASYEDVLQVANLGLLNAVTRFDRSRGAFTAFAVPTILGEIKHYYRDNGWGVHLDRKLKEDALNVKKAADTLQSRGREATLLEIAEYLEMPFVDTVDAYLAMQTGYSLFSLDQPVSDREDELTPLIDMLPGDESDDSVFEQAAHDLEIEKILGRLSVTEREMFVRHILLDQTQGETAEAVGVNNMQVSRLTARIKSGRYYSPSPRFGNTPEQQ